MFSQLLIYLDPPKTMCSLYFPPFSLISRVLQKIQREKVQGVIFVPKWPTQTWWPVLMQMLANNPILLPSRKTLLTLPGNPAKIHPYIPNWDCWCATCPEIPWKLRNFGGRFKPYHTVFKFLTAWTLGEGLSLKCLSWKLTMLLALISG